MDGGVKLIGAGIALMAVACLMGLVEDWVDDPDRASTVPWAPPFILGTLFGLSLCGLGGLVFWGLS